MSQKSYNKRDNCFYCERKFIYQNYGEGNAIIRTVDHIIPLGKGGVDSKINTVACCHHCNFLKGGDTMGEFIQKVNSLIVQGLGYKNIPKESLITVIRKATELKQYVEDKGVRLYRQKTNRPAI